MQLPKFVLNIEKKKKEKNSISKFLKQHNFKLIFLSIKKISPSKLKDPIDSMNCWEICSISWLCDQFEKLSVG